MSNISDHFLVEHGLESDLLKGVVRSIPIDHNCAVQLMGQNDFSVSHLPLHVFEPRALARLRVVCVVRNLREILLSSFAYHAFQLQQGAMPSPDRREETRKGLELYIEQSLPETVLLWHDLSLWFKFNSAITISYADLVSPNRSAATVQRIGRHFGISIGEDAALSMLGRAKAKALATKSIIHDRESVGIAWTEQCESAFRKFGCDVLQSKIDVIISSSDQN